MEKELLERLGNYWGECYYGNPGRREFKVGVAVMSKAAEPQAFGRWREVRVGTREQRVENGRGEIESVSWEGKWGPKKGGSLGRYICL